MKNIMKKVIVYTMITIFSIGIGTGVIEASPRNHHDNNQRHERHDDRRDNDRERHEKREQQRKDEIRRHEKEMQRREHESHREWQERQHRENDRHHKAMRALGFAALIYIIANQ